MSLAALRRLRAVAPWSASCSRVERPTSWSLRGFASEVPVPPGGAPPTIPGAYCESLDVELGSDRVPSTVGFETGRIARLTNGAVLASMGDTRVMCAAVCAREADPDASFHPLSVDYRERASGYGKIPSTFTRREGPPKDREVLAMRVIDRAIRPLFPKAFTNDTSVQTTVYSSDGSQDPSVLAVNGASAALSVSDIPWNGPVGAVRVAVVNGGEDVIVNPSEEDVAGSDLTLFYAGNERRTLMIEAAAVGSPKGTPEAAVAKALRAAHAAAVKLIEPQKRLQRAMGKPKRALDPVADERHRAMKEAVARECGQELRALYEEKIQSKSERGRRMAELKVRVGEALAEKGFEPSSPSSAETVGEAAAAESSERVPSTFTAKELDAAYLAVCSRMMRDLIFESSTRVDGRGLTELRALDAMTSVIPVVHGSSLFERGNTQTLATATIGGMQDVQRLDAPVGPSDKRLMLHYAFPSFSIDETPRRGPALSRREIGHGALAEKSLAAMLPSADAWPFVARVNAETLESNGSSSMAAVCAGSMALMDAGVPLAEHVGAVSVGLVMDEDEATGEVTRHAIMADLMGLEDVLGDMDFKIAGTLSGVTGIQLDCKPEGIPPDVLIDALETSRVARAEIIRRMTTAIAAPKREHELPVTAPRFANTTMDVGLLGKLIGPQGRNIRDIEETTGAKVSITQPPPGGAQAVVGVFGPNKAAMEAALERVERLKRVLEPGEVVTGTVVDVKPFGWILRTEDGDEGLMHVTELMHTNARVESGDHLPLGASVEVKVLDGPTGEKGVRFSAKALLAKPEGYVERFPEKTPRRGPPRGGGTGSSAGRGLGNPGAAKETSKFARNPDGTLERPLRRIANE